MREQQQELRNAFFERLDKLSSGSRAALKRAAGTMLSEADGRALSAFFQCLPYGVSPLEESRWFAAGCFHCLWKTGSDTVPIEQALRCMKEEFDSLQSRVAALFDQHWNADGYLLVKLSRIIKMARQKGYCIDCAALLEDLLSWNNDSQTVQRRWARAMYQIVDPLEEKGENT